MDIVVAIPYSRKHIYGALISARCPTVRAGQTRSQALQSLLREEVVSSFPFFSPSKAGKKSWNSHFPNAVYEKLAGFTPLAGKQNPAPKTALHVASSRLLDSWRWEGSRHPLGTGPGSQMLAPFYHLPQPRSGMVPMFLSEHDCPQ